MAFKKDAQRSRLLERDWHCQDAFYGGMILAFACRVDLYVHSQMTNCKECERLRGEVRARHQEALEWQSTV